MKVRFLADADFKPAIILGLKRREPMVDFLAAQGIIPDATSDPDVIALAGRLRRVLVSHDHDTMPGHFYRHLRVRESPGVILIEQLCPIGIAIKELHQVWILKEAAEFRNRITYLP